MSVFVSYKRENIDRVRDLVAALRGEGLDVWWDQDIPPHAPWETTIEARLIAAKVVIVCWSKAAVASENVRAEARVARADNRLVQTFVEACTPPLFFGERQGVDLSIWDGDSADPRYRALAEAVRALYDGRQPGAGISIKRTSGSKRIAAAITLAVTVAGAFVGWQFLANQPRASSQAPVQQRSAQPAPSLATSSVSGPNLPRIYWRIDAHTVGGSPTSGGLSLRSELEESLRAGLRELGGAGARSNVVEVAATVDGVHGAEGRFQGEAAVSMGRRGGGVECTFTLRSGARRTLPAVADEFADEILRRAEPLTVAEGEVRC